MKKKGLTLICLMLCVLLAVAGCTAAPQSEPAQAPAVETAQLAPEKTAEAPQAQPEEEEQWDRTVDLCVVGLGLSGAVTAVEANEINPNAKVLILEKMPEEESGGNSRASGQTILVVHPDDLEGFRSYLKMCNEPNPLPEELFNWWSKGMTENTAWIKRVISEVDYEFRSEARAGSTFTNSTDLGWGDMVLEFPDFFKESFRGVSTSLRQVGNSFEAGGTWMAFNKVVKNRGIEVMYETPAIELVQEKSGKVTGVVAQTKDGSQIRIKAEKGVVLACGGYENNLQMQRDFHGMDEVYTAGTPGNTGDGIQMLMKAGAQIWHMKNQTQSGGFWLGIKVPEYESSFIRAMTFKTGSWLEVDSDSQRFYNETSNYHHRHMKYIQYGRYADLPHERALPVHMIFDETLRQAEPVASLWLAWPITTNGYSWSMDNQAEIDKGWIVKADTIEELAEKIDRDPAELRATIDRYNEMARKGVDEDFGRSAESMKPIETPPYYAVSITPALVATTGGAKRDTHSRALDWNDQPIEGLFCVGELGSYVANLYQNGVFLNECILSGRAAAQYAIGGEGYVPPEEAPLENGLPFETKVRAPWEGAADGVYSGKGQSMHTEVQIDVTVTGGRVTEIAVTGGRDKMIIEDAQLQKLLDSIYAAQNITVDTISGATMDSEAIFAAVKDAFQ